MARIRSEFAEEDWHAFERTWMHDEDIGDVADRTGRPKVAIYKARFRILSRLREEVERLGDDAVHIDP